MHWIHLTDRHQLARVIVRSQEKPQVIFKHSTRCGESGESNEVLQRLQELGCQQHVDFYFLDLASFDDIAVAVSDTFRVAQESPQVLLICNGECCYSECHLGINPGDLLSSIQEKTPALATAKA